VPQRQRGVATSTGFAHAIHNQASGLDFNFTMAEASQCTEASFSSGKY
jgi:hypothetical protein